MLVQSALKFADGEFPKRWLTCFCESLLMISYHFTFLDKIFLLTSDLILKYYSRNFPNVSLNYGGGSHYVKVLSKFSTLTANVGKFAAGKFQGRAHYVKVLSKF